MTELWPKAITVAGVAALGSGVLVLAGMPSAPRNCAELRSDAHQASAWGPTREFVELPKPNAIQAVTGSPRATGAPPVEPTVAPIANVEAIPTEDPYAG